MKRVLCFIVVLAIAASMCIGVLSVSADGEATLILSKTVVRADAGSIRPKSRVRPLMRLGSEFLQRPI